MGIRFGGKEYIFLDLDCVPKILKLTRFRMHFLLKRNLLIKKFINQKCVVLLCQGALIYVTPARLISRMLPAPQTGPSNPLYRHHHSPTPQS